MLKITDSKVFSTIEADITNGELFKAMKAINEEAITNKDALITEDNCKSLKYFFDTPDKVCPGKAVFRAHLKSGKIKLVHTPTSKLQTLVYAFPIASGRETYLVMNATHFFTSEEQLTDTGSKHVYMARKQENNFMAEIANVALMVLAVADSSGTIHTHVNTKKEMMNLYSTMFTNVVCRQGSMGVKTDTAKVIRYLANTFFLKHVMQTETPVEVLSGLGANQADISSDVKKNTDLKVSLSSRANTWYENINEFVELLKELYPSIGNISVANLVNQYNLAYTPCSVMCLDYLPYVAGLFAATATKNIVFGGASFRNKIPVMPTPAVRVMQEIL